MGNQADAADGTCSVLVVEDDHDIAATMAEVIEGEGYRVLLAGNGREALAVLETQRPSLILVDLFMPEMSGVELLRAIKKNPRLATIPRVIMTAANDQMIGVREDLPVLYKPVDFDTLTAMLRRYCHSPQALPL